ncbi:MAG: uroporphyrinogen decarboxylase family protein [Planctomycetota bacterium]
MTNRQRVLAVLRGETPDRMAWIPRMELWYRAAVKQNALPDRYRGMTLRQIEHALGCGTPARSGRIFTKRHETVDVVDRRESNLKVTEYRTPVGTVRQVMQFSDELTRHGLPGHVIEYPLKTADDYTVWTYIAEHTYWDPAFDAYEAYDRDIGDDGLPMTPIGDVPFHQFVRELAGYDHAFFHLVDYPDHVDALLKTLTDVFAERLLPLVLKSPAALLLHGGHLSTQYTPPPLFEKYILPHCERFFGDIHAAGKFLTMHADNDTSAILPQLRAGGWDLMECFATAPLVPVTLADAFDAWGDDVAIWGGVPSSILGPECPQRDFEAHLDTILETIDGHPRIILGISDNLMPGAWIERVERISRTLGLMN